MMWRHASAVMLFLCTAGLSRPETLSPDTGKIITGVFDKVGALQPMKEASTYTLLVGGKPMTGRANDFLRRRTAEEILQSGLTGGCGDNAIVAFYLIEKRGYQTLFIDSAQISTESLEYGFSGHAAVALHDPKADTWVFVDPTRVEYSWPWTVTDKAFYGNYWIGFRGRLADYPAHDPESLKKFYRDTLKTIPLEILNQTLFAFRFTVDPSLVGPGGKYLNPNLDRFLKDNGRILSAHGVHPVNEAAIRLTRGAGDSNSHLAYRDKEGWVCTVGLQSALSLGFVGMLETTLNTARTKGQPLGIVAPPAKSRAILWTGCGILGMAILAVLYWQRRRFAGRETVLAFWACQLVGWVAVPILLYETGVATTSGDVGDVVSNLASWSVSGILLTSLLRREMRRRAWLTLTAGRMLPRLLLAVLSLAALQVALITVWGLVEVFFVHHHVGTEGMQSPRELLAVWAFLSSEFAVWVALYVLITGPRRQRELQMQLQLALREAELRALEAQINPHFLFNCLNSIRALVAENPARSQDMITRLANILRYNLRNDVDHTVSLNSEAEIVGDYLALESARFDDRLRVKMSISPAAGEVQVPPMLLQSLVENAIKHGIAKLPSGGDLLIRATIVGDAMLMEVENPGRIAGAAPEALQMGLANIRERLRILYRGRASFELKNRDGRVAASVLIPTAA